MTDHESYESETTDDLGTDKTSGDSSDNSDKPGNPLYNAAVAWWKKGANPIPAAEDGSKRPMPGQPGTSDAYNWHQYANTVRPSMADLYEWYVVQGRQSLGLAMGPSSLIQLTCLDFEEAARVHVFDEVRELRERDARFDGIMRRISDGYLEQTAGHGWHSLYSCDCGIYHGSEKLIREPEIDVFQNPVFKTDGSRDTTLLLETKANGGFVILAPSNGTTHATGKPWVRKQGGPDTITHLTQADCEYLRSMLGSLDRMPVSESSEDFTTNTSSTLLGDRFNKHEPWDKILTREHGYVPFLDHAGKQKTDRNKWTYWTCQAKVDQARQLGHPASPSCSTGVRSNNGKDLLVVFGGEHPCGFRPGESYSKFRAYTYLNFGTAQADFRAAALSLKDKYGDKGASFGDQDIWEEGERPKQTAPSTWAPTGFDFGTPAPVPSVLQRTDGAFLIYPGMRNVVFGPPEAAKSWLVAFAIVQVVEAAELADPGGKDKVAVIIDHEDTGSIWGRRLKQLGLTEEAADRRVSYVSPEEAPKDGEIKRELGHDLETAKVVGVDSMNESMYLLGLNPDRNHEVGQWRQQYLAPLERATDAAIFVIDHTGHVNPAERLAAIGAQTKLSGVRGSQIKVEVIDQPTPGRTGRMRLVVTKDPNGAVRAKGVSLGDRRHGVGLFIIEPVPGTSPERLRCAIHAMKPAAAAGMIIDIVKALQKSEEQAKLCGVDLAAKDSAGQLTWTASKRDVITNLRAMKVKGTDSVMLKEIDRAAEEGYIRCLVKPGKTPDKSGTNGYRSIQDITDAPF